MNYLLEQLQDQERAGLDIAGWHLTSACEETVVLGMRSQLIGELELLIAKRGWTQAQATKELRIAQSRVSDLVRQVGQIHSTWIG